MKGLEGLHVSTPMTGLLDVVLDPDFARNHTIYFTYFEYLDKTVYNTAIARAVLDESAGAIRDVKVLLKTLPFAPNDQTLSAGTKTGGRIAIGADGFLYVTIGDRDNAGTRPWPVAQYLDTHLGKVLRITKDGKPAPGNPYIGKAGALPEIWAIGLRSPEGLAFAPDGKLYEVEHGPRGGDEFNLIKKSANYGWPIITHGIDYPGKPVGDDKVAMPGMEQPVYYWSPSTAPGGLAFYKGKSQAWANSVFVGMLNGHMLDRIKLVNGKVVDEEALLTDLHAAHPGCAHGLGRRGLCGHGLRRHRHHRSDAGHRPADQAGAGTLVHHLPFEGLCTTTPFRSRLHKTPGPAQKLTRSIEELHRP